MKTRSRWPFAGLILALAAAGCAFAELKATSFEPEDGSVSSRPVRSLRVWFDAEPAVDKSSLSLEGPEGALEVTGLHTMGDDDLMARVVGAMPNGVYTAKWVAATAEGEPQEGGWTFEVKRGSEPSATKDGSEGEDAE